MAAQLLLAQTHAIQFLLLLLLLLLLLPAVCV
jgi:hypothetical protein